MMIKKVKEFQTPVVLDMKKSRDTEITPSNRKEIKFIFRVKNQNKTILQFKTNFVMLGI